MSAVSPHIQSWEAIDWKKIHRYVKRLRQRIFRAEQLGQKRKVRKLQRLMIRSNANLLLSIKRVTQINKGKQTAGVDGQIVLTSSDRLKLYNCLKEYNIKYIRPKPAKRAYIPKKNGKMRPLGIPIIKDRILQNIVKNALEPQWEAKFEPSSYGLDLNEVLKMPLSIYLLNYHQEAQENGYLKVILKAALIISTISILWTA
jgi:RNA-directed DNA polymerase